MKLKKLFLVSSLFLAGGIFATSGEQITKVDAATTKTYEKVTTALTDYSGEYLIVYESESGNLAFNGSLTALDAASNNVSVTITDNKIEASSDYSFTIESVTGGYSIKSYSGYYIGNNSNSNALNANKTTQYVNSISLESDGSATIKSSGGAFLRYNSAKNNERFRYFKSSSYTNQKAIQLYKEVIDTSSYTVDLDAGLSSFNDDVTTYYTGTVGEKTSITMPSLTDLTNNGLIYAETAKVSGWTDGTKNYELGQTYEFTDKATLTPTYTQLTSEITISKANEICEEVGSTETIFDYKAKGKVSSIGFEYSESNDNITLTISDDDSAIKCYKLTSGENSNASSLKVGDIIIVTGKLIKYSGTNEFNEGCTFEDVVLSASDMFQQETTTTKLTASYTKTTKTVESDNAKYGYEFTQKVFEKNETKSLGDVNWTLDGDGGYWGACDSTKGQQLGSSGSPYKVMTLTSETSFKNVSSIIINTSGAKSINATLTVTVGGTQVGETETLTKDATDYTFTPDTPLTGAVEFSYTQTSSKGLYIKSIEITYADTIEQSTYEINDAKIGFATLMSSKSYDASAKYGILVVPTDELNATGETTIRNDIYENGQSLNDLIAELTEFEISCMTYEITPVKCDVNGAEDENGDYYQFGVVFNGSLEKKDVSLTAVGYMELDGQVYLTSNETAYSLESLAQAYIDNGTFSGNADAIGVLNSIING